jgi:hypothetical protein
MGMQSSSCPYWMRHWYSSDKLDKRTDVSCLSGVQWDFVNHAKNQVRFRLEVSLPPKSGTRSKLQNEESCRYCPDEVPESWKT